MGGLPNESERGSRSKKRHTPGAEAPICGVVERPKAEALGYLEAKAMQRQAEEAEAKTEAETRIEARTKTKTTTQADPPPSAKDDN
jgi:hypothetical protein